MLSKQKWLSREAQPNRLKFMLNYSSFFYSLKQNYEKKSNDVFVFSYCVN